jgi:peroxiredoxin
MLDDVTEVNVGSLAPDFHLESNEGTIVRLSEYRGRTHVVLYFMREFT